MNAHWLKISGGLLIAGGIILSGNNGFASQPTAPEPEKIQPEAVKALIGMSDYLNSLPAFTVNTEVSMDEVLLNGQKIMVTGTERFVIRQPDRLRVSAKMVESHRDNEYFYDGKTLTVYGNETKYYAFIDAPPSIGELLDVAEEDYNVIIPLRDLFYWGTEKEREKDLSSATYVGTVPVDGTDCKHYAFRQEDVDWQIWIEDDDTPVPRRLVITSKQENGQPQYSTTMTWDTAPVPDDSIFTFTPPKGAMEIDFAIVKDTGEQESTAKQQ